jgi:hypothetical protein
LGQLVEDGVVEHQGYFDSLIPVDAFDTRLLEYKSNGMKLTEINNTESPAPYTDATIIEVAFSREYDSSVEAMSILGLTLNHTLEDFKKLLGEPSMELERDFASAKTPGLVCYWENILIDGTKQTFDIQVIVLDNELHFIKLCFD